MKTCANSHLWAEAEAVEATTKATKVSDKNQVSCHIYPTLCVAPLVIHSAPESRKLQAIRIDSVCKLLVSLHNEVNKKNLAQWCGILILIRGASELFLNTLWRRNEKLL